MNGVVAFMAESGEVGGVVFVENQSGGWVLYISLCIGILLRVDMVDFGGELCTTVGAHSVRKYLSIVSRRS